MKNKTLLILAVLVTSAASASALLSVALGTMVPLQIAAGLSAIPVIGVALLATWILLPSIILAPVRLACGGKLPFEGKLHRARIQRYSAQF